MARILVVDDEENIRFTFESFLTDEGHAVALAGSVAEARRQLDATDFDLVFADIILGDGQGIDILRTLREGCANCPVVMITGQPTLETAAAAVRLGAFDYVPKPVRQRTLLDTAARALKHKAAADEQARYHCRLEAIFRSVPDAIVTVDRDLIITGVNEAAGSVCGLSPTSVGKSLGSFPRCFREDCLERLAQAIRAGHAEEALSCESPSKDGGTRVVTIRTSPLRDEQAAISGAMLVIKDEPPWDSPEQYRQAGGQFHNIVGQGEKMQQVFSLIKELAKVPTTVLITGETGTGKELAAAALHFQGDRRAKPFVKINCSALPENLLESELFGHVKGAFTGALQKKIGRFERADGGTLLLDEIGDISPAVQLRLLRVLQEGEFERVGDSSPIKVDVRVVAATNKDLREKVRQSLFRDDLYYRLKVVELHLPALRERQEDIPRLTQHFLDKFGKRFHKEIASVTADVERLFLAYPWPGNVRELEHALEHAFIMCRRGVITLADLPPELRDFTAAASRPAGEGSFPDQEAIESALKKTAGNKAKAARLLGISRQTIYRKTEAAAIKSNNDETATLLPATHL